MKTVSVLGAGMVGAAIARDLAPDFNVRLFDRDEAALAAADLAGIDCQRADLGTVAAIQEACRNTDLVVGAVPGFMGYCTLEAVLQQGRDCVDISFFPEDPFSLSELARAKNVQAVFDCGVAPGLSHMLLGCRYDQPDVRAYRCLVGGLPIARELPWQYKAPFSPIDVLEEYTRPARFRRAGKLVEMPALSEAEHISFAQLGSLEAVNTDGLRSLLQTMPLPDMVEKTLRYPGHYDRVRQLQEDGFLDTRKIRVGGQEVSPLELSAALLLPAWQLLIDEDECTVMRVEVDSLRQGLIQRECWDLFDRRDAQGVSSMARTTGYTCTATLRALAEGLLKRRGLIAPEQVGQEKPAFERILQLLRDRNIDLCYTSATIVEDSQA